MIHDLCWGGKVLHAIKSKGYSKWKPNCKPVMNFYCGRYKGQTLASRGGHKFHACDVCVNHFFWEMPPIMEYGCWMSQLRNKWCGTPPAGTVPWNQGYKGKVVHEPEWLKTHPKPAEMKAFWWENPENF